MSEENMLDRIQRLEAADKDLSAHIQALAIQTERIAVATEVLNEAMSRQYEQNTKLNDLGNRVTKVEGVTNLLKTVGGTILTVAVGMVMFYLFGAGTKG